MEQIEISRAAIALLQEKRLECLSDTDTIAWCILMHTKHHIQDQITEYLYGGKEL